MNGRIRIPVIPVVLAMLLLGGCTQYEPLGVNFYRARDPEMHQVTRIVFVNLSQDVGYPEIARRMTNALQEAMLQQGMFRVDVINVEHADLRDLNLTKREPFTVAELAEIRKSLRCDAILFGKMIRYQPYPSTLIGLYMRLVNLKDGRLLWAVDDTWDTTDRSTFRQIKEYYFDEMRDTYDPAKADIGIMSTDGFQKFVAHQVVLTMDPQWRGESKSRRFFLRPMERLGRHGTKTTKDVIADY